MIKCALIYTMGTLSRSNWDLEMLFYEEREKLEHAEKTSWNKDENRQQTQPTYDAESGNRTQATLVERECSHHCIIPAPPQLRRSS